MSQETLENAQRVDLFIATSINKGRRNLALFIAFTLAAIIAFLHWPPWNLIWPAIVLLYASVAQLNLRLLQTELQKREDEQRRNSSIELEDIESALLNIKDKISMARSEEEKEILKKQLNKIHDTLESRTFITKKKIELIRQDLLKEVQERHPSLNAKSFFPEFDEWILQEENRHLQDSTEEAFVRYCDELEDCYNEYMQEEETICTEDECLSPKAMTIQEAEKILDVLSTALQQTGHYHKPLSSLQGYDLRDICIVLKVRTAREYLHMAQGNGSEQSFLESLKLYDGILWSLSVFVPDDRVDSLWAESPFNPIDPVTNQIKEPFASLETCTSFGAYCRSIEAHDPLYWQKVYPRILEEWEQNTD